MADGITVVVFGDLVVVTTTVGDKVARVRVTKEYANALAARLIVAAAVVSRGEPEPELDAKGRYHDA